MVWLDTAIVVLVLGLFIHEVAWPTLTLKRPFPLLRKWLSK